LEETQTNNSTVMLATQLAMPWHHAFREFQSDLGLALSSPP